MKKTSFISALSIGVLSISMTFASPADAVNQVRENSVQVLKILNSGDANTARQKAEAYAIPYFDFQRMTALAVGNPWRTATDAQKQALTKEFQTLLIRTYSGTMLKFKNAKVNIKDNPVVNKGGKEVVVRAEINVSGQKTGQHGLHHLPKRQQIPRIQCRSRRRKLGYRIPQPIRRNHQSQRHRRPDCRLESQKRR